MDALDFLQRVLPAHGHYCLFHKAGGFPQHEWFTSVEALHVACTNHESLEDLYFATAAFRAPTSRTQDNVAQLQALRIDIDAGTKKYEKDPEGTYSTQREAVLALGHAIKAGLPKPTFILSSGEGIHAYWQLTQALEPTDWVRSAGLLQLACSSLGLKVDPKVTKDTARVLRPLQSLHNNGLRVGATLFKDLGTTYSTYIINGLLTDCLSEEARFDAAAQASKVKRSINDDILEIKGPPASIAKVADHCASVAWVRDTKGSVPEPVWRLFMGVAKYCEDGQDFIHPWSEGDSRYDFHATQTKFDRWVTPPATCDSFVPYGKCTGCKHRGSITTPKQLGYVEVPAVLEAVPAVASTLDIEDDEPEVEAAPQAPTSVESVMEDDSPVPGRPDLFDPTQNFFYMKRNGNWVLFVRKTKEGKDATGAKVTHEFVLPVVHKLIWVASCTETGASENNGTLTMLGRLDSIKSKRYVVTPMPAEVSAMPDTMSKYLHNQGVILDPSNPTAARDVSEFIRYEQIKEQNNMRFVLKNRFGYHIHEGKLICSQGVYTVYPQGHERGEIQRTVINPKLQAVAAALGTSCLPESRDGRWAGSVWKSHVAPAASKYISFVRKHYGHEGFEIARLALAVPLASPFLVFCADAPMGDDPELPATGLVVSLFSQGSGKGKSAVQEVIAAAYGKPSLKRAGKKGAMTVIASNDLAHATGIYPFILDEVTRNNAEEAATMIDTFANGQGRIRSSPNGTVSGAAKTWASVTCISTNVPQRELISSAQKSSDALSLRLLELDFDRIVSSGNHSEFTEDFKALTPCTGAYGMLLAWLTVNKGLDKINELAQEAMRTAYEYLACGQEYRFFARGLAATMVMCRLLGKWSPFDEAELMQTYKEAVAAAVWHNARARGDTNGDLAKMLASLSPNIAVTSSWSKRTRGADGRDGVDLLFNPNVRLPLAGREIQDRDLVVVDSAAIKKWCTENQVGYKAFLDTAHRNGTLLCKDEKRSPTKTRLNTGVKSLPTQVVAAYTFRVRSGEAAETTEAVT